MQNPAGVSEFSVTEEGLVDILCVGTSGTVVGCTCAATSTSPFQAPFRVDQKLGDTREYDRVSVGVWRGFDMSAGTKYSGNITANITVFANFTQT